MMNHLKFYTSGESHGKSLVGIIEGLPANLNIDPKEIDSDLKRRQMGYGRGSRMKIENDAVEIISGVRWGKTTGAPISLLLQNKDFKNWAEGMSVLSQHEGSIPAVIRPRPGHADLNGVLKYHQRDVRNILERSSARETAMRVALGAIAKIFLNYFNIKIGSFVTQIGNVSIDFDSIDISSPTYLNSLFDTAEHSDVRCPDESLSIKMKNHIDEAMSKGDTLGGEFIVFAYGIPIGLGSHIQWDKRLDARLAYCIMSIQAIKGISFGIGFNYASAFGSSVMDEIFYDNKINGFYRLTNNAGGIEGGISNGMPIVFKAVMKPIPTLRKPLCSVDLTTKQNVEAAYERSDTCAVPAAAIVAEAMTALCLADAFLEKFAGDSMQETSNNYDSFIHSIKNY